MTRPNRIVIYGNAGSGKTTMARQVAAERGLVHLSLDHIAWGAAGVRLPFADSLQELQTFMTSHSDWVIEGCYGDLIAAAIPQATELRFLNPGIAACLRNAHSRPWEPSYCESPEEQQRLLEPLTAFIREYETRTDEFSLARHRELFEAFVGPKQEFGDFKSEPTES